VCRTWATLSRVMTSPEHPGAPPPEVPEEFAAAYRAAYQRALEAGLRPDGPGITLATVEAGDTTAQGEQAPGPERRATPFAALRPLLERWRSSRWFALSAGVAASAVLVAAAYSVGTTFSGDGSPGADATAVPQSSRTGSARSGEPSKAVPTRTSTQRVPGAWQGAVVPVPVDAIAADCTAPPGTDSAGHTVTYVPQNAVDGRSQTAWRCTGTAVGQKLTLRLSGDSDIAQVGLVPGYAKTDPESGVDRYAENNRITRVRWTLGDGVSFVQRLDPGASSRAMQVLRVPRTSTDTVILQILAVAHGPRDTTAISEISLSAG